jgi:hypothetical protein
MPPYRTITSNEEPENPYLGCCMEKIRLVYNYCDGHRRRVRSLMWILLLH